VIIVASAGNEGENRNNYPAKLDGVIAVSALDRNNKPATYTNIESTNIFAPGDHMLTTGVSKDNFTWLNGTSAATPLVTSICSILKYYMPDWNSNTIKNVILTYSKKEIYENKEVNILDVRKVLNYVKSISSPRLLMQKSIIKTKEFPEFKKQF
jgi:subtilisin family serine protease